MELTIPVSKINESEGQGFLELQETDPLRETPFVDNILNPYLKEIFVD
jgi:hypothetical protein